MRVVRRELSFDDAAVLALATAAGAHGVYVRNAAALGEGDGFVLSGNGRDLGLVWIGPRGNLVIVAAGAALDEVAARVADEIGRRQRAWRIAMGPTAVVERLRERLAVRPLACRDQVYYVGDRARADRSRVRDDVRTAERGDRDRLVQATLALNASDLNVDPARVDRRWLRDTIDERIAAGTTRVVGPVGGFRCKLDLGSSGPGGDVIEGVFTFPDARGLGFAAGLVATCLAQAEGDVCLHVGAHNEPARAAYASAGMEPEGSCRLLLLP